MSFYDREPRFNALRAKAVELMQKNLEHPTYPGWKTQMCCMPGVGKIWQWDSCFMALYALDLPGIVEPMNNLDNLYLCQREDGFMSMAYIIETRQPAFGELINPPLFAWVELEYFKRTGDDSRFARVFPILDNYYLWLKNNRRRKSGLYFFESPGASGMDNSPRGGWPSFQNKGSDVCHIDLICQQLLSARCLAEIAAKTGSGKAEFYLKEADELVDLINHYHWNAKTGFYYDVFDRGRCVPYLSMIGNKTAAAFWALVSGAASAEQADALEKHLLDPDEFFTAHPVPSISRDDPNYRTDGGYWLGGVWPPIVYMVVAGLKKYGKLDTAKLIARKHLEAMCRTFDEFEPNTIWECYSPEFMLPAKREDGSWVRKDFVGWGGLGPIALLSDMELWQSE